MNHCRRRNRHCSKSTWKRGWGEGSPSMQYRFSPGLTTKYRAYYQTKGKKPFPGKGSVGESPRCEGEETSSLLVKHQSLFANTPPPSDNLTWTSYRRVGRQHHDRRNTSTRDAISTPPCTCASRLAVISSLRFIALPGITIESPLLSALTYDV